MIKLMAINPLIPEFLKSTLKESNQVRIIIGNKGLNKNIKQIMANSVDPDY